MIKVDIKQYMAMLSSFTECAQYRSECYRLEAENEKLRSKLLDSLRFLVLPVIRLTTLIMVAEWELTKYESCVRDSS